MDKEKNKFTPKIITGVVILVLLGLIIVSTTYSQKGSKGEAENNKQAPKIEESTNYTSPENIKITDQSHIRGNEGAKVTMVEYSDFQCPFCKKFDDTVKKVMEKYPNDVRLVYKQFPLSNIHPFALRAANASECASEQGKFWEYADQLFANQSSLNADYFSTAASKLNLDVERFDSCLSGNKYAQKVQNDYNEGLELGISGTPTTFINGQKLVGTASFEQVDQIIQQELAK